MLLLEFQQFETIQRVGLFKNEAEVIEWLNHINLVKKREDQIGHKFITDYYIEFNSLPAYEEIEWKKSKFILSKYMFSSEGGDILAVWHDIQELSDVDGFVNETARVGAYVLASESVQKYIEDFEAMKKFLVRYYSQNNKEVHIYGANSEDGEYLEVDGRLVCHLEGDTVEQWRNRISDEAFISMLAD